MFMHTLSHGSAQWHVRASVFALCVCVCVPARACPRVCMLLSRLEPTRSLVVALRAEVWTHARTHARITAHGRENAYANVHEHVHGLVYGNGARPMMVPGADEGHAMPGADEGLGPQRG